MNDSPRILIIRLSSLGDILHTLPAFESLKASFPDSRIDWLGAEKSKFLLTAIPGIHTRHFLDIGNLLKFPPDRSSWKRLHSLIRTLRSQKYDFAIDFQGLIKTAVLSKLSGSEIRLGLSKELIRERPAHWVYHQTLQKPQSPVHITALNQRLAELTGAHSVHRTSHNFIVSSNDSEHVEALLRRQNINDFIVLNPGGGWPTKRWAPEKFGALSQKISQDLNLPVLITTGPGEESLYQTIAENSGYFQPHHFPVSFLQLIPLLQKATLLVGGDTGPFHLACALGTAVVGIFGPTSPARNGPWSREDEAVTCSLSCSPCHQRACTRNSDCMNISVDKVFEAIVRRVNKKSKEVVSAPQ